MNGPNFFLAIAIHVLICVIMVYDTILWSRHGLDHTITHVIRAWSHEFPPLPFAMGFLACHLMGA